MDSASKQQPLIEVAPPLRPNCVLRLLMFWLPMICAVAVFWYSVVAGVFAMLAAFWISGYIAYPWQIKPLPTDAEISAMGGHRFVRPSDGKVMEYWLSGRAGSKRVVAFCHRMDGKQGAEYGHEQVAKVLQEFDACLVSPSCPACSASPPYDTNSPVQWLKKYTDDWIALLQQLGAEEVCVTGVSFGGQLTASLADALKKRGMLRASAPIAGFWFNTKKEKYLEMKGLSLASSGILMRPIYYYCWGMLQGSVADTEKMFKSAGEAGEAEIKYLKQHWGSDDLSSWNKGMVRTHEYFRDYALQYTIIAAKPEADSYVDWSSLNDASVPFVLWYAANDLDTAVTKQAQEKVKAGVGSHAQIKLYEGTHGGFPLHDIIRDMFDGRT